MIDFLKFKNELFKSELASLLEIDDDNLFYIDYEKNIVIKRVFNFTEFEKVSIENWIKPYIEIGQFASFKISDNKINIYF